MSGPLTPAELAAFLAATTPAQRRAVVNEARLRRTDERRLDDAVIDALRRFAEENKS